MTTTAARGQPAVLQHPGQPLARVGGIERHVGAARLEHPSSATTSSGERSTQSATGTSGPTPSARRRRASRSARRVELARRSAARSPKTSAAASGRRAPPAPRTARAGRPPPPDGSVSFHSQRAAGARPRPSSGRSETAPPGVGRRAARAASRSAAPAASTVRGVEQVGVVLEGAGEPLPVVLDRARVRSNLAVPPWTSTRRPAPGRRQLERAAAARSAARSITWKSGVRPRSRSGRSSSTSCSNGRSWWA